MTTAGGDVAAGYAMGVAYLAMAIAFAKRDRLLEPTMARPPRGNQFYTDCFHAMTESPRPSAAAPARTKSRASAATQSIIGSLARW